MQPRNTSLLCRYSNTAVMLLCMAYTWGALLLMHEHAAHKVAHQHGLSKYKTQDATCQALMKCVVGPKGSFSVQCFSTNAPDEICNLRHNEREAQHYDALIVRTNGAQHHLLDNYSLKH